MSKFKEKVLVVCPGRGSYTKSELGYLRRYRPRIDDFVSRLDEKLQRSGQPTVTELDEAERFSLKTHTPGEYASTLIYACSVADFRAIDQDRYEVVAVTGNSMGWYTTLALAGALSEDAAFSVIHGMGSMMKDGIIGGQLIYPLVGDDWNEDPQRRQVFEEVMAEAGRMEGAEVYLSIRFGGYAIVGGNELGLRVLKERLPPVDDRYPFVLVNHAAFHTPLLRETSQKGFQLLPASLFRPPEVPVIDGRGHIWQPYSTSVERLWDYTLGHQVYEPYDFTAAVEVGLKEFAPSKVILLGPGNGLGGAVAQVMIKNRWLGLSSKEGFATLQKTDPYVLAMGREEQAAMARS